MLSLHLLFFVELRERIWHGYPDFTVFYTAATMLRGGLGPQLYDERTQYRVQEEFIGSIESRRGPLPYIHPPFEAVIFVPLTFLPYREAFVAWGLLNATALFGVALILRRRLEALRSIPAWEFALSFLAFFPIFLCFLQGQDSIVVFLVCTLAYTALKKEADVLAGCWLALGTVKLQMVLPLVLLLLLWRRKRVAAGFAGVAIVLAAASFLLVGWHGLLQYPGYVLQIAREPGLGGVPAELMPNLRGLVEGWPWTLAPGLLTTLVAASSGILIFFAAQKGTAASRARFDLQFSLAVVVTALVSWHTNAHDLAVLILPLALLANHCYSRREDLARARLAVMLPALPLLISPLWIALWLWASKLNLMAIPLLWWGWEIGREAARSGHSALELST
jgi:hypothetical protein